MSDKPTTIGSNVGIEVGPMVTIFGKLKTVRNTQKAASFRILCPGCLDLDPANGVAIMQQTTCVHGHGPYTAEETPNRGRQEGDRLVPLTAEEVAAIKGEDVDGKVLTLRYHPASQVTDLNRPTGIVYHFEPGPAKAGLQVVGALLDLISDGELIIIGELFVKKARRLFRFQATPHGLELVEMARPEDVFDFEAVDYPYEAGTLTAVMALAEALTTDYDPAAYRNGAVERLARVMAAKEDGAIATVTSLPAPVAAGPGDLEAVLAASLAAARANKAA